MSDIVWHQLKMAGPNAPAPYKVTQSSLYDNYYPGWCIFSNDTKSSVPNECWAPTAGILTGWVMIDLGSPKPLSVYTMRIRGALNGFPYTSMASAWLLKGSNDGVNFTTVDQRSGIKNWSASVPEQTFTLERDVSYRFYRLEVTANSGYSGYMSVGRMVLGYIPKFSAFYNPNTGKHFVVKNNALVEIDGSPETIGQDGMPTGTMIDVTTLPNFTDLVGVPINIRTYSDRTSPPIINVDRVISGREYLTSQPISLVGVDEIVKFNLVSTGDVRHIVSVDNGATWLKYASGAWVQAADDGNSSAELNVLNSANIAGLLETRPNTIMFKHSFGQGSTLTSAVITSNLSGDISVASTTDYVQTFDQVNKTITYAIKKAGRYSVNYMDAD